MGVEGQLEVPHGGKDRPVQGRRLEGVVAVSEIGQVRLVARDDENGHLRQVLDEPLCRRHQAPEVVIRKEVGDHRPTGHAQIGLPVQVPDLAAKVRIADDDPAPRLLVRAIGGMEGDPQALTELGGSTGAVKSSDRRADRVEVRSCSMSMACSRAPVA